MVAATALILLLSLIIRAPCTGGLGAGSVLAERYCYTDILPIYGARGFSRDALPYLEARNEYPVGMGLAMYGAARLSRSAVGFFSTTIVLLSMAAGLTALLLYRLRGRSALFFAASPSLALYAFLNWDLLAVAAATGATYAFLRRRHLLAGVLIGLGAAIKLYPVVLLPAFALERWRQGRHGAAWPLLSGAGGMWMALNAPFMILAPTRWTEFYRFNASRPPDWGSVWATGCSLVTRQMVCPSDLDAFVALGFALAVIGAWAAWRHWVGAVDWRFAFPVLLCFLALNKVASPQYSLWVLPWFPLLLPRMDLFVTYSLVDVLVFLTHFGWQARLHGYGGTPLAWLEIAGILRTAVLAAMVVATLRSQGPGPTSDAGDGSTSDRGGAR
ncbi:MAG TPA: glycosyltransferase 87 family protein [Actinomycetota bacterium]|nr:glycosyltransferase 87 family protein [Actinomycetota bacterium]